MKGFVNNYSIYRFTDQFIHTVEDNSKINSEIS